jgi:hypothetical protein
MAICETLSIGPDYFVLKASPAEDVIQYTPEKVSNMPIAVYKDRPFFAQQLLCDLEPLGNPRPQVSRYAIISKRDCSLTISSGSSR